MCPPSVGGGGIHPKVADSDLAVIPMKMLVIFVLEKVSRDSSCLSSLGGRGECFEANQGISSCQTTISRVPKRQWNRLRTEFLCAQLWVPVLPSVRFMNVGGSVCLLISVFTHLPRGEMGCTIHEPFPLV